jgi:hypothetical protein
MTTAELKDMWHEENWERKVNQIPRISWKQFKARETARQNSEGLNWFREFSTE